MRIRSKQSPAPHYERPPQPRKRDYIQTSTPDDYYPLPGDRDHRALLAAQLHRDMLLAADPEWWAWREGDE